MTADDRRQADDAAQRVMRMNRRAQSFVDDEQTRFDHRPPPKNTAHRETAPPPRTKPKGLLDMLDFKNINLGSDNILVIVLILLMSRDDGDELLMLALLYIMM